MNICDNLISHCSPLISCCVLEMRFIKWCKKVCRTSLYETRKFLITYFLLMYFCCSGVTSLCLCVLLLVDSLLRSTVCAQSPLVARAINPVVIRILIRDKSVVTTILTTAIAIVIVIQIIIITMIILQ